MIDPRLPLLFLLLSASVAVGQDKPRQKASQKPSALSAPPMGSFIIQQRLIIRVPRLPIGRAPFPEGAAPPPPIKWVEKKTDQCVAATSLAAAAITRADSVDLVLNGGKRLRARLADNCPALDFYTGFYLKPASDGKVCASRDSLRSRSGQECRIESFRALVPGR
jgi:hypothetical protein